MTFKYVLGVLSLAALFLVVGCAGDDDPSDLTTSGVALSVDILGDSDVVGMRFTVDRVACNSEAFEAMRWTKDVELEDMFLPNAPTYGDNPFAETSSHLFADSFFWLAAGCYDVTSQPLNAAGGPSSDCAGASEAGVTVLDGQVTEITLVMQCTGPEAGGLDVAGALNHPPLIDLVTYSPSKFAFVCEEATLCASASDPDSDPLEFEWSSLSSALIVAQSTTTDGLTQSCAQVIVGEAGTEQITVTVYDLYIDETGAMQRIEDLVAPEESRDSITLPLHIGEWDDAFAGQEGVRDVAFDAACLAN